MKRLGREQRRRRLTYPEPAEHGVKPLLRGWFHALAAVGAVIATIGLLNQPYQRTSHFVAALIFGWSMIMLYVASATYHIGPWRGRVHIALRVFDHASIYVLIAGTYTPICVVVLSGWLRATMLIMVWSLAILGILATSVSFHLPRWRSTALYLGMGWVAVLPFPELVRTLPAQALAAMGVGALFYTTGAVIYAWRKPNPWPRIFGFHEIFHLFVVGGNAAFLVAIWRWVLPMGTS